MKRLAPAFLAAFFLVPAAICGASQQVDVTTYYDAPFADYRELRVSGSLTLGEADANVGTISIGTGSYTAAFYGGFNVLNNDFPERFAEHHGGTLTVDGSMDIQDAGGSSLFYVDAVNNRVGLGTRTPAATLDVKGEVKGMSIFAYSDPLEQNQPYAEMSSEHDDGARFCGAYWDYVNPQRFRYCTTHIDGNPLVLQSIDKTGTANIDQIGAGGHGEVIIMGRRTGYVATGNTVILVVGEPFEGQTLSPDPNDVAPPSEPDQGNYPNSVPGSSPAVPMPGSVAYAHGWYQYSSREYKKDIVPLMPAEYDALLAKFMTTNIVHYRLKSENEKMSKHLGYVAEEAPVEMTDNDPKSISLGEEASVLLAVAKTVRLEQEDVHRRLEALKTK